jgi:hypothetical protein
MAHNMVVRTPRLFGCRSALDKDSQDEQDSVNGVMSQCEVQPVRNGGKIDLEEMNVNGTQLGVIQNYKVIISLR